MSLFLNSILISLVFYPIYRKIFWKLVGEKELHAGFDDWTIEYLTELILNEYMQNMMCLVLTCFVTNMDNQVWKEHDKTSACVCIILMLCIDK